MSVGFMQTSALNLCSLPEPTILIKKAVCFYKLFQIFVIFGKLSLIFFIDRPSDPLGKLLYN